MKAKCLNPVQAWVCGTVRCKSDNIISQRMVFSPNEALSYFTAIYGSGVAEVMMERHSVAVPCGKCMACQIRKRKDMTTRLSHEASMFEDKCCFITLTYDDDHLPVTDFRSIKDYDLNRLGWSSRELKSVDRGLGNLPFPTLLPSDVQKFLKRLRRYLEYVPTKRPDGRDHATNIRYYAVGEYGGRTGRPHYHLLIFGWCPSDMEFHSLRKGNSVYTSKQLTKLWKFGFHTVQTVKGGVAKYCARYVTKKFARLSSSDPFRDCVVPEFILQSVKNGGIGATWFDSHAEDMFLKGYASVRTDYGYINASIPAYYWRRCRIKHPVLWLELRDEKITFAREHVGAIEGYDDLVRSVACYEQREKQLVYDELF